MAILLLCTRTRAMQSDLDNQFTFDMIGRGYTAPILDQP